MKFYFRLVGLTIARFAVLLALGIFIQRFEVSPLPEWTLYAFAYVAQFAITFFFAWLAMRRVIPDIKKTAIVAAFFLVLGTALEGGMYLLLTGATLRGLAANYTWQSLYLVGWYALAVGVAGWYARRSRPTLAEGLGG